MRALYRCSCARTPPLCDGCVGDEVFHIGGNAMARGTYWAEKLAHVIPLDRPWPPTTDRMRAMARRKVTDLTRDDRVIEIFTDLVIEHAASWWETMRKWRYV